MASFKALAEEFLRRVNYYKSLGVDPLSLATGCAVKVDLIKVVYPALKSLKPDLERKGVKIAPREDADIFALTSRGYSVERRIYALPNPQIDIDDLRRIGPNRAITLVQVHQKFADDPSTFASIMSDVYTKISEARLNLTIGKGHSIITPFKDSQFILFDFIKTDRGSLEGYGLANNDTIHIIDPTDEPGSYNQAAGALSNALNDLFVMGVYKDLIALPTLDAPTEELYKDILKNFERYANKYNIRLLNTLQPRTNKLLMGATVIGITDKVPPIFNKWAEPGMKLLITRPMGELTPINVYMFVMIGGEDVLVELEEWGYSIEDLERLKNEATEIIAKPNMKVAKIINDYLPSVGEEFDPSEHIVTTIDITGPGIYVIKELAEKMNAEIRISDMPLLYSDLCKFATSNYVIPNSTAGTNGAFVIVARENVVEEIYTKLKTIGLMPHVIGEIVKVRGAKVYAPSCIKEYIADTKVLSEFVLYR